MKKFRTQGASRRTRRRLQTKGSTNMDLMRTEKENKDQLDSAWKNNKARVIIIIQTLLRVTNFSFYARSHLTFLNWPNYVFQTVTHSAGVIIRHRFNQWELMDWKKMIIRRELMVKVYQWLCTESPRQAVEVRVSWCRYPHLLLTCVVFFLRAWSLSSALCLLHGLLFSVKGHRVVFLITSTRWWP